MKLKLTDDLVLIEPLSRPRITSSGIEIPESAAEAEPHYGEVVEVGPGRWGEDGRILIRLRPGDRVFYNPLNCYPIIYNGKGHFFVREHAIFAVITEDEKRQETLVSEQSSRLECPEHGAGCLKEAVHDGRRGVYCPISKKFYREEELKGE